MSNFGVQIDIAMHGSRTHNHIFGKMQERATGAGMPMTIRMSKSKSEVEFQYGGYRTDTCSTERISS